MEGGGAAAGSRHRRGGCLPVTAREKSRQHRGDRTYVSAFAGGTLASQRQLTLRQSAALRHFPTISCSRRRLHCRTDGQQA